MQDVIETCFPMRGELGQVRIAVFSEADVLNDPTKINRHYELGGIVILLKPTKEAYERLAEGFEHPDAMPDFPGNGIFLFAYDRDHNHYSISEDTDPDDSYEEVAGDRLEDLVNAGAGNSDDQNLPDKPEEADEHIHSLEYFCGRLTPFVEWLNEIAAEPDQRALSRAGGDGYDPRADISNSYKDYIIQVPVKLHHMIRHLSGSKKDYLNADGEIKIKARVFPLFMFSESGGSSSGDYYIVEATVTAYNQQLWKCDYHTHGAMRDYIIGYYMKQLSVAFRLCADAKGGSIAGLGFYSEPNPKNVNSSKTYTNSTSIGCDVAVSGGYSEKNGWNAGLNVGFKASRTSGDSYSLSDVATTLDSYNANVSYCYDVQNISNNKDYKDSKNGKGYPQLSRGEMTAYAAWIWHIPYGTAGVEDNSVKSFSMSITTNARYGCYSWYRPKVTPREDEFSIDEHCSVQPVWRPDRRRFGVLALRNAGPATVANVEIQKRNESGKFVSCTLVQSSYNTNEVARVKLLEGVYRFKYNTIDTSDGNKVTGTWLSPACSVRMGRDESSSTIEVSTVNATKD